jgi:SHS2 domain-containing protein
MLLHAVVVYNILLLQEKKMVKRKYRLIEHTADVGLVAYGDTLADAFASAATGMFSIITDLRRVKEEESRQVEASADDAEGLLFEWLNNLLYYFDVEMLLFRRFDIEIFDENKLKPSTTLRLKTTCYGEQYNSARHHLKTGIKSATYHLLRVDREQNRVRVIFDI